MQPSDHYHFAPFLTNLKRFLTNLKKSMIFDWFKKFFISGSHQTAFFDQGRQPANHYHLAPLLDATMGRRVSFVHRKIICSGWKPGKFSERPVQICYHNRLANFSRCQYLDQRIFVSINRSDTTQCLSISNGFFRRYQFVATPFEYCGQYSRYQQKIFEKPHVFRLNLTREVSMEASFEVFYT